MTNRTKSVPASSFVRWLDVFLEEKAIDLTEWFTVAGSAGPNHMTYEVVIEHIKLACTSEQQAIRNMMVRIDFHNGDVRHFLRHLASAIAI